MPEQDKNHQYFEQARQATLAQIEGNQQAMLADAMTQPQAEPETLQPAVVRASAEEALPTLPGIQGPTRVDTPNTTPVGYDEWLDKTYAEAYQRSRQLEMDRILDPRIQRAESARKWITGIGDALASMANLAGTGDYASNQPQTYALPAVNDAIEKDRARRTAQYQRQIDHINALELQKAKAEAEAAEKQAQRDFTAAENEKTWQANKERYEAEAAAKKEENDRKFDYQKEKDNRTFDLNEWKANQQVAQGWARVNKGDTPSGDGDEGTASSRRFSGKRGGGIKEAKTDYNSMLDIIAENNGCENWADLTNRAKNDRTLREIYNKFDLGKDKAGAARIEGMISSYAKNYAPEFYEYYYGRSAGDGNVDFNAYKPTGQGAAAAPSGGGTLSGIMSSTPQGTGKKRKKNK